jgi:tryptophan synthase alpha chain
MTEILKRFNELKSKKQGALIAYLTVGDPHPKKTPRLAGALIDGGADILELGIPFSDPIADGPTIQSAVSRSLASGSRPTDALNIAQEIKDRYDIPLVLMSYFNPIFRFGAAQFITLAKKSGMSGFIIPDLPVEESQKYKKECVALGMDTIFLASPSTDTTRLKRILGQTSGYLYLISLYGVTGIRTRITESATSMIKKYHDILAGSVPLAVGFGISKTEHVRQVIKAGADGAIIGSAFVKIIEDNRRNIPRAAKKLKSLARTMKKGTITA